MNAIAHSLQSLPFTQLRKNKRFYLWYDGTYAALCIAALAAMHFGHLKPLMATWDWKLLALMLPFATQAQILCTVFVHNCTHNGFPSVPAALVLPPSITASIRRNASGPRATGFFPAKGYCPRALCRFCTHEAKVW